MRITFSPQRRDDKLIVSKDGDKLTINGDVYDFSVIPDGAMLPAEAIPGEFIVGPVIRINGEIEITLLLPHGPNPPQSVAFPKDIVIIQDGDIPIPSHFYEPPPEPLVHDPNEDISNDKN